MKTYIFGLFSLFLATQVQAINVEEVVESDENVYRTYRAVCQVLNNPEEKLSDPDSQGTREELEIVTAQWKEAYSRSRKTAEFWRLHDKIGYTSSAFSSRDIQATAQKRAYEIGVQLNQERTEEETLLEKRAALLKRSLVLPNFSNMPVANLTAIQDILRTLHNTRESLTTNSRKKALEDLTDLGLDRILEPLFTHYPEVDFPFPEKTTPGK